MSTTSRKAATTLAAALALLVVTNPAQADFTLGLQEDNGALIGVTASRDGGVTYEGSVFQLGSHVLTVLSEVFVENAVEPQVTMESPAVRDVA